MKESRLLTDFWFWLLAVVAGSALSVFSQREGWGIDGRVAVAALAVAALAIVASTARM